MGRRQKGEAKQGSKEKNEEKKFNTECTENTESAEERINAEVTPTKSGQAPNTEDAEKKKKKRIPRSARDDKFFGCANSETQERAALGMTRLW